MPLGNYKRQLGNDEPLIVPMDSLQNKTTTPAVNLNMPESTFGMIRQGTEKLRSLEMPFLPKTSALRYLPGELAAETERLIIPQSEVEGLMQIAPMGMVAKSIGKTPIGKKIAQIGTKKVSEVAPKIFQGFQDLTTKFLNYAKGKTILSKQEIMDFAKRPELKKGEADLLNRLGNEVKEAKLPAQEFADSIRRDLLELKPVKVKNPEYGRVNINETIPTPYERVGEAKKYLRKSENYEEVVFESPITTNGSSHFPNSKNYFAHARGDEVVEGGKKIWREQEIQSDLLQKEGMRNLITPRYAESEKMLAYRNREVRQLDPFTNDRFGERIMRERIKDKAQQGYQSYRLPTGETIGKIEGFESRQWGSKELRKKLEPNDLKVGMEINEIPSRERYTPDVMDSWIITDILGDGRFKAVPKSNYQMAMDVKNGVVPKNMEKYIQNSDLARIKPDDYIENLKETFDLTGKSNPQYRRYSDWGKFLKNKYGGKEVVDPQGNSWIEIDLKPEYKKAPIEAFGLGLLPALKEQDENNQSTQKRISFLKKNQ